MGQYLCKVHAVDWIILVASLAFIVIYGTYKSREAHTTESFLRGTKQVPWYTIGLSIMATQASAVTFLSAPGQAYEDGMRFVQFYFGLPFAMVVLCITFVPIFHRLGVYTAYEYLETRFDKKTRSLGAILFLIQRGLSTSLTIYAPSLVLSAMLGWPTIITNSIIGGLVIIYTVAGGTRAVSYTQQQQMVIILTSMAIAFGLLLHMLPPDVSFSDAVDIAALAGKMNTIDWHLDLTSKYNVWSGLIGGFFLALSYFGTDHSQVSRYLTGTSVRDSQLGLLMNGVVKIPMQFGILFIGVILYVFFVFTQPPLIFNPIEAARLQQSASAPALASLSARYAQLHAERSATATRLALPTPSGNDRAAFLAQSKVLTDIRSQTAQLQKASNPKANEKDTNYIFLYFVTRYLPIGMVGLLLAVIFAASMSSTASALNSLASVSVIDVYKRSFVTEASDGHYLLASRLATVFWGIFAVFFAELAGKLGSLIEAVNLLGSLFYGAILGLFVVAFYFKRIGATAVFYAAVLAEVCIFLLYYYTTVPYLWYNVIGCGLVVGIGMTIQFGSKNLNKTIIKSI